MAYSTIPTSGINLNGITTIDFAYTNGTTAESIPSFGPLGTEVFGSDGLRYVFAKAAATLTPSTATCSIDTTAFIATSTGGAYIAPAVALASGEYGWFGKASV